VRIREFAKYYRAQWRLINKDFGLEVFDNRIGGTVFRLEDAAEEILKYVNGERDSLPELEQERLPFHTYGNEKNVPISCFYIKETKTVGRFI